MSSPGLLPVPTLRALPRASEGGPLFATHAGPQAGGKSAKLQPTPVPPRRKVDGVDPRAPWLALAYRSALPTAEALRIALGPGPDPAAFPPDVLARESRDLAALDALGVRLLTIADPDYPQRLREGPAPLVLQVAGRVDLLHRPRVDVLAGHKRLAPCLEDGTAAVAVLSKGMLRARTLLRALHEPIEEGRIALVTAEPPRASWGPVRDRHRDALCASLRR